MASILYSGGGHSIYYNWNLTGTRAGEVGDVSGAAEVGNQKLYERLALFSAPESIPWIQEHPEDACYL